MESATSLEDDASELRLAAQPQANLTLLVDDDHILAVNKPAGIVIHPAYRHIGDTLCDAVFALQACRGQSRPWLLHRLDRETSGVVLFAKTDLARRALVRQFERHSIAKRYLALVEGQISPSEGVLDVPLARDPLDRRRVIASATGQPARTAYRVIASRDGHALVLAEPVTGRTHQIRAHLAHTGNPLVGDVLYAGNSTDVTQWPRAMLHAASIRFIYPGTGQPCTVIAPIPEDFVHMTAQLGFAHELDAFIQTLQEASCN